MEVGYLQAYENLLQQSRLLKLRELRCDIDYLKKIKTSNNVNGLNYFGKILIDMNPKSFFCHNVEIFPIYLNQKH